MQEIQVSGSEAASLFDTTSEETLTPEERAILRSLLSQNDRVDIALPDDISASDLWMTFDICARVFVRVRRASGLLKLLIGRALTVIQAKPEVYISRGFRSFDDFISNEERGLPKLTGISRAELYKAKAVAQSIGPETNMQAIRDVGSFTKIQIIASQMESTDSRFDTVMEHAKTDTVPQLRERMARMGLVGSTDDIEWDIIQFSVTKTQKRMMQEFLTNPRVRAYCETESPGVILERAIQEAMGEWEVRQIEIEGQATEA